MLLCLVLLVFLCESCKKDLKDGYVYCSQCGGDGWNEGVCKLCGGQGQIAKKNIYSFPSFPTTTSTTDNNISSSYSEESDDDFPTIETNEPSGHFEYVRKQVPCHVCDGQGFKSSNLTASGKVRCGFCSGKGYETITEQEWVE